jgi:hypothetical protein
MIFFGMRHASLDAREYFPDALLREWDVAERKTFIIALYYVRSFLTSRDNTHVSLQVNLCQLNHLLKKLVRREYYAYKRYKKDQSRFGLIYECKQYKRFLILSSLTYYLLLYISSMHTKKTVFNFIKHEGMDSFLYTFFFELTKKIDFDWYDIESLEFNFTFSDESLLFLRYPKKISFQALGSIFLLEKTDPHHKLFHIMELFIKRVFLPVSLEKYRESLDDIEKLKKNII